MWLPARAKIRSALGRAILIFRTESNQPFFVDRIDREVNLPFKFKQMNTCEINIMISRMGGDMSLVTHRR